MRVLYFAWLKAKTGVMEEEFALPAGVTDVEGLTAYLSSRSRGHADALADRRLVRVAVNQDHVGWDHAVADGDEVAFFPPVTGG